ncbi:alpha/beta hydrolase [Microterricola viridarii]|uniref:Esterase n=1 Tax=Microterricola viridarii TaxID=412690 RepID=A0A0X8E1J2_9MICO|nr:alpha/beta hydrolase-fold protein [Microterricola viridarii]AMB58659.1 hypothetical protein AWU67_07065 [Microterricola viridarii]
MLNTLLNASVTSGWFVVAVFAIALALLGLTVVRRGERGWTTARWSAAVMVAATIGGAFGWLLCWLVSEVWDVFGVGLSLAVHSAVALGFAAIGVGLLAMTRRGAWHRLGAVGLVLSALLVAATLINIDFGRYATVQQALGLNSYSSALLPSRASSNTEQDTEAAQAQQLADWQPPANLPATGTVHQVTIPATTSHFAARPALVYLPPAALVANPPRLPVIIALSGQPGSPSDVFEGGKLQSQLDAAAAADRGLAPIVVVPDQLGDPANNPMCVDSALGNSASYLSVDVPNWIRSTLNVAQGRTHWAIAGFSQGATCAVQLGTGFNQLFGSFLAIAPELGPNIGDQATTVAKGFAGSVAAFDAAQPLAIMKRQTPFADTVGVFAIGASDQQFQAYTTTLRAGADAAGIATSLFTSPGTGHDWHTGAYGFAQGLAVLLPRLGLSPAASHG